MKGARIVVHMGIDTVALEGKGFTRLVEEGAEVKAGQPIHGNGSGIPERQCSFND